MNTTNESYREREFIFSRILKYNVKRLLSNAACVYMFKAEPVVRLSARDLASECRLYSAITLKPEIVPVLPLREVNFSRSSTRNFGAGQVQYKLHNVTHLDAYSSRNVFVARIII